MRLSTSPASRGSPTQLSGMPRRNLLRQRLPGKENSPFRSATAGKQGGAASTIYSAPIERGELCPSRAPGNRGPPGSKGAITGPNPKLGDGGHPLSPYSGFIATLIPGRWNRE